jgi:hypothetical protein
MRDAHYTDQALAEQLARACHGILPVAVADFASGTGALLAVAADKWPTARLLAVDIASEVELKLNEKVPRATFINLDFLSTAMPTLAEVGLFDVILLNPPFSCHGSATIEVSLGGTLLRCSRAFAFVVKSLCYLSSDGVLAAILPSSCLFSDKDRRVRDALDKLYEIDQVPLEVSPRFRGVSVNTAVLKFRKRRLPKLSAATMFHPDSNSLVRIIRGARPNSTAQGQTPLPCFVHTTELIGNDVQFTRSPSAHRRDRCVVGPAILMPRVGKPNPGKLALLTAHQVVRISDCVIAVMHPEDALVEELFRSLCRDWHNVKNLYQGTCAPYTTVTRLANYLSSAVALDRRISAAA